jgi:hypothetical protein
MTAVITDWAFELMGLKTFFGRCAFRSQAEAGFNYRCEIAEYANCLLSLLWAFWFLVLSDYPTPAYAVMERYAALHWYGLIALVVGLWQVAVALGVFVRAKKWASFWAAVMWATIALLLFIGAPRSTASPTIAVAALQSAWLYLRLGRKTT